MERTRNLLRAIDRQDRLETAENFVGWLPRQTAEGRLNESTHEVLLRALRAASDPLNFRILALLDPLTAVEIPALMTETGLGRVAVSERVNDLAQVGMAGRELVSDQIRGTALGAGIVELVRVVATDAAERLSGELIEGAGSTASDG